MRGGDRKRAEVLRMMLDPVRPDVPAELIRRATERGARLLRRRRAARRLLWTLLIVVLVVFSVWASAAHPWSVPPAETTPPLEDW
ncbi:hypothetical protein [Streptomyces sp. 35G-GA-8]|uniref:hypothetical protein n=1 Tax=Streptomyces sp. 35G-GA-8 TaxID=2939434 RepID=UPI00201EA42B|nr:hypothetical protein [Streptomyces sp. 35G-GA-8]MCL7376087.1 hypothetical protein [Streptomyces sp. 35G-GA-8]